VLLHTVALTTQDDCKTSDCTDCTVQHTHTHKAAYQSQISADQYKGVQLCQHRLHVLLHAVALTSQDGLQKNSVQYRPVKNSTNVSAPAQYASPRCGSHQSKWTARQQETVQMCQHCLHMLCKTMPSSAQQCRSRAETLLQNNSCFSRLLSVCCLCANATVVSQQV
jgi:hypothetical protein